MLRQKKQSSIKRLVQQCRTRWQHSDRYQHLVYSENKAAERCCIVACGYYGSPSYKGLMGVWEKTMHNLEDNENKGNGALGGIISQKNQVINQESDGVNILDTVGTRSPKRLRRQPLTRNNDFLWTTSTKNKQGE